MVDSNVFSPKKYSFSHAHHASSLSFEYKTVAQGFEELATQYPDYECYIFKDENKRYTYAAFKYEIDCMAKSLFELGFKKNDRLAVCLPNSSENVALTYVVSKLGLVKVHLDPCAVARELANGLSKLDCKGIVVSASDTALNKLKDTLSNLGHESSESVPTLQHIILTGLNHQNTALQIGSTHSYNDLIKKGGVQNIEKNDLFHEHVSSIDLNMPLSILLTSGSTGQPKAVVLTNFAIINSTKVLANHFGTFCLRYCAPLSMAHISTGIRGILLPSATICTVIVPARSNNSEAVMRAIDEEKCTCMMSGPALFYNILSHPDRHKYDMTSLQFVSLSGTSINAELLRKLETELGIGRAGQVYGMTESASLLTSSLYAKWDDNRKHTSIGRCMPHIELKLVDDNGVIVPIGVQGEIWARCYAIMRGYYNDYGKTIETINDDGWLRTGDLARMDQDGYLYFIGRKTHIIIRAMGNVYPLEIELAIEEHPSVFEAHVFSIPDSLTDAVVCAFVVLQSTEKCEVNELKLFLSNKLSAYKIPEHIRFVDEFPRTSTGKVSKLKLAEMMLKEINATNKPTA